MAEAHDEHASLPGSVGTASARARNARRPRPRADGAGRCRRGCRSTSAQKAAAPAPRQGVAHMAAAKQGHGRARALQAGGQAGGIGRASGSKPGRCTTPPAALAQGGAQGIAHLRLARLARQAAARASAMAWRSRWPPPMVPITRSASTAIQARFPRGRAFGRLHAHQPRGCALCSARPPANLHPSHRPFHLKAARGVTASQPLCFELSDSPPACHPFPPQPPRAPKATGSWLRWLGQRHGWSGCL